MSPCLREPALWRVAQGGGGAEERGHLAACLPCTARARRLQQDLMVIQQALRAGPPSGGVHRTASAAPRRAIVGAAVAAALAVVVGLGAWLWPTGLGRPPRAGDTDPLALAREVATVLRLPGQAGVDPTAGILAALEESEGLAGLGEEWLEAWDDEAWWDD